MIQLPFMAPETERQVCDSWRQKARSCCNLSSRDCICSQAVSGLPVTTHVFLGSWMAQIFQECHRVRSAPCGDTWPTCNYLLWSTQETEQLGPGRCTPALAVATPMWSSHCKYSPHMTAAFAVSLPLHSTGEQVGPNKWPLLLPRVRAEVRH